AEAFASVDVILRNLQATLGPAQPAHAMGQPRRSEPDLSDFQSIADAEQHIVIADFKAVEFELAVAAVLLGPHDRDTPDYAPARLIAVVEKRRQAAALVVGGSGDDDEMRSFGGAGDEPLAPVNDPFAVFLLGARADHAGIGAAARRRFGHRERGFH